ncbi:hypothetical protein BOTBODRAFT_33831 [Botryobasidium botryosum FD-172 SS1]|uniref:Uncharacterized protein n=1 Tax=Botryobasidium botryosum (strain FD-172 SS1) TaxID=930990 RepID=A0A067MET1_BOTB1|nr:hypothetical protein BOTBODRAFT_33831 [Botryobasidium botryosum FD-172 SS1]
MVKFPLQNLLGLTSIASFTAVATTPPSANKTLEITAIAAKDGVSVFECWALEPGFLQSAQPGTVGAEILQLGNLANASYSVIPPRFNAGAHNAPNIQCVSTQPISTMILFFFTLTRYVAFLSGLARVTLPTTNATADISGGAKGLIIATDVASVSNGGHITEYPSDESTIALQIPTLDGNVPGHTVVHGGPCR